MFGVYSWLTWQLDQFSTGITDHMICCVLISVRFFFFFTRFFCRTNCSDQISNNFHVYNGSMSINFHFIPRNDRLFRMYAKKKIAWNTVQSRTLMLSRSIKTFICFVFQRISMILYSIVFVYLLRRETLKIKQIINREGEKEKKMTSCYVSSLISSNFFLHFLYTRWLPNFSFFRFIHRYLKHKNDGWGWGK